MPRTFDFKWFKVKWLARYGWTLQRAPAVVVVPVDPDGRLWLIKVNRPPTGAESWEFPGGEIEGGEDPLRAGLRELEEECGLVAKGGARLLPTVFELAPGMGTSPHRLVIARDVVPKARRPVPQTEEGITTVKRFELARLRTMTRSGGISVLPTLAALAVVGSLEKPAGYRPSGK
jgi:8-oxo-dGTP pyrophosphatase MutT (NUDIX family)